MTKKEKFITQSIEKFGDKFIKDYVEYTKQFIKDIENENKM